MHLSEGVLHTPILLAGAVLAVAGIAVGLRRLESERLPLTALFAAAFFVAGTIHVPVGIGSVHLILNVRYQFLRAHEWFQQVRKWMIKQE